MLMDKLSRRGSVECTSPRCTAVQRARGKGFCSVTLMMPLLSPPFVRVTQSENLLCFSDFTAVAVKAEQLESGTAAGLEPTRWEGQRAIDYAVAAQDLKGSAVRCWPEVFGDHKAVEFLFQGRLNRTGAQVFAPTGGYVRARSTSYKERGLRKLLGRLREANRQYGNKPQDPALIRSIYRTWPRTLAWPGWCAAEDVVSAALQAETKHINSSRLLPWKQAMSRMDKYATRWIKGKHIVAPPQVLATKDDVCAVDP